MRNRQKKLYANEDDEWMMGHGVGPYLGLHEIGSQSSIIIFIIMRYLFNHTF